MQIEEVIQQAEHEASLAATELDQLRGRLVAVQERYERAAHDLAALKDIASRYGTTGGAPSPPVEKGDSAPWSLLNRQQAVLRSMREIARPVRLPEIVAYLQERGRSNENVHLVSATLAALKRKGYVQSVERGTWELSDSPAAQLLPTVSAEEDTG